MGPIREMLAKSNINEQKWRVLRVLNENGPMEHTAIAEASCLLLPSLTRILAALEADGLVNRAPGAQDRRKSIATITDAGRRLIISHMEESDAIFDRLRQRFGQDKLETLLDLLDELRTIDLRPEDP